MVASAGEYRRLTGNIFVFGGVLRMLGDSERIPRPLEVVHSGRTTTAESGFSLRTVDKGTRRAPLGGITCGKRRARSMAWNREIGWTSLVSG